MSPDSLANLRELPKADRRCRACFEPLPVTAIKCRHCGSFQNWRRFLDVGSALPTLALTLVSLLLAGPPLWELLTEKRARINIAVLEGDGLNTTFMVSNVGNRPAAVSRIEVKASKKNTTFYLQSDLDKKLLEPGKPVLVSASNGSLTPTVVPHEVLAMIPHGDRVGPRCQLVLVYLQMSGTKEYLHHPFDCIDAPVRIEAPPLQTK